MKKFINVRLKGSKNLNSIYVENGVIPIAEGLVPLRVPGLD